MSPDCAQRLQENEVPAMKNTLEAIRYKRGQLELLDQKQLPLVSEYIAIPDSEAAWHAIKDMVVRGAPAIAVTAVLALAVEVVKLINGFEGNASDSASYIQQRLKYLVSSRPTAVNLADASQKLQAVARRASTKASATPTTVFLEYVEAAEAVLAADVVSNKAIGHFGAEAILNSTAPATAVRILTHCNTGSLATAGYGTALGVVRSLHAQSRLGRAWCTETRPYNQGSRLTAYELVHDGIPAVLIADSAAAALLASGGVDAVVVGADRVAANGDTANKIGTLSLALSAWQLGIPFFVAAPVTTIDASTPTGDGIVIEERPHHELTHAGGGSGPRVAAPGIEVWNPGFDVTPAKFITGIITDKGVIWRDEKSQSFDVVRFLDGQEDQVQNFAVDARNSGTGREDGTDSKSGFGAEFGVANSDIGGEDGFDGVNGPRQKERGYVSLDEEAAKEYLASVPALAERLGGSSRARDWDVREVGDGNLNYVYIVMSPGYGSLVLKQALPYVRCVGDSWPMTLERSYFEWRALTREAELVPDHVPEVYHFDHPMAAIAMRYVEPPHIILRKGLIKGLVYPRLAEHISTFMARTLFHTSLLALSTFQHKEAVAESYANVEMNRLTEQVIFTEPYRVASNNRWTSPQLDEDARAIREDGELKLEIAELKVKFCSQTQALLHGDLHTGSLMVTETSTQVIDPEFSFYGPAGFDIGAFLGNLILAYYSQDGHSQGEGDRQEYKRWILQTISETWTLFERKFKAEWDKQWGGATPGDAYVPEVFNTEELREMAKARYLLDLFHDSLGFAGAKMIRRIVGISHVEDLESILDANRRAKAERGALTAAKILVKQRKQFTRIAQVVDFLSGLHV